MGRGERWRGGVIIIRGDERQYRHRAPKFTAMRAVIRKFGECRMERPRLEQAIDEVDDDWRRAPRGGETVCVGGEVLAQPGLRGGEELRLGAAEAINRLLAVAHQKAAARAFALGRRQLLQRRKLEMPLRRMGILRLVDQEVIYTLVELVLHPQRMVAVMHESIGLPLQIGEFVLAPLGLYALIVV